MMADDKKKQATIIVASMKKPKSESAPEQPSEDVSELEVAADEIMQALERKDSKAMSEALKSFVEMCKYESEPEESEESEEA